MTGREELAPTQIVFLWKNICTRACRDWILVLVGSIAFIALGAGWGLAVNRRSFDVLVQFIAIGSAIFCVVALVHLIPRNSFLKISPDGMTVRSLWRTTEYRWVDIQAFGVAEFQTEQGGQRQTHQRVGFNFSRYSPPLKSVASADRLNKRVGGFEAALPDTYGKNCAELAAYLNRQRNRFLGQNRAHSIKKMKIETISSSC